MELTIFEILSLNAILVPALVTLWALFLRREMAKSIIRFRAALKTYEKEKAKELLQRVKEAEMERNETEAMERIAEYTDDWTYASDAISLLRNRENRIYKYGKGVIVLLAVNFILGLYAADNPQALLFGDVTRMGALIGVFALELIVVFYWIYLIFDFGRILSKITGGEREDIEEIIEEVIESIKKEEEY